MGKKKRVNKGTDESISKEPKAQVKETAEKKEVEVIPVNHEVPLEFEETEAAPLYDDNNAEIRRRRIIRLSVVTGVIISTLLLAVVAGVALALADTEKNFNDLICLISGTYAMANVHESDAPQYVDDVPYAEDIESDNNENVPEETENSDKATEDEKDTETDTSTEEAIADTADDSGDSGDEVSTEEDESNIPVINEVEKPDELVGVDSIVAASADADTAAAQGPIIPEYVDPNAGYPLQFTTVAQDYFDDALFIGDSRLEGLGLYSGLHGTFYTKTGFQLFKYDTMKAAQTPEGKMPIFDAIPYDAFTKIYIKVGLNEMGGSQAAFEAKYAELIARLRQCEPRAIIYIHGLLPVTASKSNSDKTHNNANIYTRNEALKKFAVTQQAYYLDIASAVASADGSLPSEMAGDGIHLKAQYIDIWKQFLMTHAINVLE